MTACSAELAADGLYPVSSEASPPPGPVQSLTADATRATPPSASPTVPPTATLVPIVEPPSVAPTIDSPLPSVTVPILYLHKVLRIPADIFSWTYQQRQDFLRYTETPCELSAQLGWLAAHHYTTILPRDLAAYWDDHRPLPARPVMITFDDGTADWARTVLPLLQAHDFRAEFYVTVHYIGVNIAAADVRALADAGMGIGAHDMDHVQIAGGGVNTASIETMRYQVGAARVALEAQLGMSVDAMAYVGGGYDATMIRVAREAGYTSARAIVRGVVQSTGHRFDLRVSRLGIFDDVVGKTIENAMACNLDPALADFQARVSGTDPG